jgi:broad specificity phosphatase PhoE
MRKIIHCIRHGESTFNASYRETGIDPLHFDARLTPLGEEQVHQAARAVRDVPYELIVSSPLTRALQTTLGLFSEHRSADAIRVECLHRERLENSCDVGRAPAALLCEFPRWAFDHLDEIWWHDSGERDPRGFAIEPLAVLEERVRRFRDWLSARPETLIAVVGHGTFFHHLTGRQLHNCEIAALDLSPVRESA